MSKLTEFYNYGAEIAMTKIAKDMSAEEINRRRLLATGLTALRLPIAPTLASAPGHRVDGIVGGVAGSLVGNVGAGLLAEVLTRGRATAPAAKMGAYAGNVLGTYLGHGNNKEK